MECAIDRGSFLEWLDGLVQEENWGWMVDGMVKLEESQTTGATV